MEEKSENKRYVKIFGIYFGLLIAFVVVRLGAVYGLFDNLGDEITTDAISTAIIQIGIMFLVPFFLYMALFSKTPKKTFEDFKFKRIGIVAVLICILLGILGFVINIYSSTFFSIILRYLGYDNFGGGSGMAYDTLPKFLFGVASVALLPAICEEFAHRGLLLHGTRKVWGYKTAIIVSSIFFGLMHLNIQQFFFATVLGIMMAFADISGGSIYPSMIMHFVNNFISVLISYLESLGIIKFSLSGLLTSLYSQSVVLFILIVASILFACVVTILFLIKLLHKTSIQNRNKKLQVQAENSVQTTMEESQNQQQKQSISQWLETNVAKDDSKKLDVPFIEKVPFILCLFLSVLVTVFTFIWGVI